MPYKTKAILSLIFLFIMIPSTTEKQDDNYHFSIPFPSHSPQPTLQILIYPKTNQLTERRD
jgi:hypothetical protein